MAILAGASSPLSGEVQIGEFGAIDTPTEINRNKFADNTVGIRATANTRVRIESNDFANYDFDAAVNGLSTSFLTDNSFSVSAAGNQFENTGDFANTNLCNNYNGNIVGTNIVGLNRGFTFRQEDFATVSHDLFIEGPQGNPGNIGSFQGSSGAARWNYFSAGKSENIKTSTVQPDNFTSIFWYFHPNPSIDPRLKPKCALNGGCIPASNFINLQTPGGFVSCSFPNPNEPPCLTRPCLENVRAQLAQKSPLLEQGKSSVLFTALQTDGGSQATFNQLNAASPYLTDDLLKAIADNATMNQSNKEQLLTTNAALTPDVMNYLPGKISEAALTNLQSIAQANPVSAHSTLEAEVQGLTTQRELITDELIHSYRAAGQWNEVETLLNEDLNSYNRRRLFGAKVEQKDFVAAGAVLQAFPLLTTDDQYFVQVQNINLARLSGSYTLNANDEALLNQIADSPTPSAGYAQTLLGILTGQIFMPQLPDLGGERSQEYIEKQAVDHLIAESRFAVSPNPADEAVQIRTLHPLTFGLGQIDFYDMVTGRLVRTAQIPDQSVLTIPVHDLPGGLYLLALRENGHCTARQKLLIQH